ncbi:hypothetical protein GCM10010168_35170 [Actinoplanes ianthinogenes]|uniref:Uncharacterized protein n=1 Tax=Actinoplanes ianthinogenes TaxID=122358 RepID=A0ABM7M5N8_9ACTN|nr:hypothetical protein [Actinoplanes ianthinogenes]BCJ46963.1 hypothetical protein Aiant_76200 [Actinoplanes ianthinogenes]GGR14333.1 hypothetical protein GCM10010168_35170 [Actinoplanes ianthinogenes]
MTQGGEGVPEHLLGYGLDPKWRDMSDYLVHFTESEESLLSILRDGMIRPGGKAFGSAANLESRLRNQKSICLSEIPVDQLHRLMKRHGRYGLAFTRTFIRTEGGARVWYLDPDAPSREAISRMIGQAMKGGIDSADEIWKLTPFIDRVTPGHYEFEWEREWRVMGGLVFEQSDISFIIVPAGARGRIEQLSTPIPYVYHDGSATGWVAIPEILANEMDRMTAEFLESFGDPNDHLSWEKGEYFWTVPEWSTTEAAEFLFPLWLTSAWSSSSFT